MSKEEVNEIKYIYDPLYRGKQSKRKNRSIYQEYLKNVKDAELKILKLENKRQYEIERVNNERWHSLAGGLLKYSLIEGRIHINEIEYLFSSIRGAEVVKEDTYRVETKETGKSKKHVSLGGAVTGGVLFGPLGAVVGGSVLGKTTSKGSSVSNSIPTCSSLSVVVDLDGFKREISVLKREVDKSSAIYVDALESANEIFSKLHFLSTQPIPESFKKIEEELCILEIDKSIKIAQEELARIKEQKPLYDDIKKHLHNKD